MISADNDTIEKGQVLHDLFREVFALQAVLESVMDRAHEKTGLTSPYRKIMNVLMEKNNATVPDIAGIMGVSRQFVQKNCNRLFESGLIRFKENPQHRRSRLIALTETGRKKLALAQFMENKMIAEAMPEVNTGGAMDALELLASIRQGIAGLR